MQFGASAMLMKLPITVSTRIHIIYNSIYLSSSENMRVIRTDVAMQPSVKLSCPQAHKGPYTMVRSGGGGDGGGGGRRGVDQPRVRPLRYKSKLCLGHALHIHIKGRIHPRGIHPHGSSVY